MGKPPYVPPISKAQRHEKRLASVNTKTGRDALITGNHGRGGVCVTYDTEEPEADGRLSTLPLPLPDLWQLRSSSSHSFVVYIPTLFFCCRVPAVAGGKAQELRGPYLSPVRLFSLSPMA